jgi:hypothetical protein
MEHPNVIAVAMNFKILDCPLSFAENIQTDNPPHQRLPPPAV